MSIMIDMDHTKMTRFKATSSSSSSSSLNNEPDMKKPVKKGSSPLASFCISVLLVFLFLFLLLVAIDQLGFPTVIEACYKFPEGTRDPCIDLDCKYGAECIRSKDGKKAECLCPEKCYTFGDSVGSRPVCGSDGRDYPNDCELRKRSCPLNKNIVAKFQGRCNPCDQVECSGNEVCQLDDVRNPICRCNSVCSQEFKPVCGSDGKTYVNECVLRVEACKARKSLRILYNGECGSGRATNPCESLKCSPHQECDIDRYGIASCVCPAPCPPILDPVCGSDGITYDSECALRRESCVRQADVSVIFKGLCEDADSCHKISCDFGSICFINATTSEPGCQCQTCSEEYKPVCASDGLTYLNECKLKRQTCLTKEPIGIEYASACRGCENKNCEYYSTCQSDGQGFGNCVCPTCPDSAEPSPVCGSDGVTYDSECQLKRNSCLNKQNIAISAKGVCDVCFNVRCKYGAKCDAGRCICPTDCPDQPEPVCSSQGVTYTNECHLRRQACQLSEDVSIAFYGPCHDILEKEQSHHQSNSHRDGEDRSKCYCNRYGSFNSECTGRQEECICRPGVGGSLCDRCDPDFWGLQKISEGNPGCQPCDCNQLGSVRSDCEQMTGRCVCKFGVLGSKCDKCPPGRILTIHGCTDETISRPVSKPCAQVTCEHGAVCREKNRKAQCFCEDTCSASSMTSLEDNSRQVCGSDGQTYSSECDLKLYSCRIQESIIPIFNGPCKKNFSAAGCFDGLCTSMSLTSRDGISTATTLKVRRYTNEIVIENKNPEPKSTTTTIFQSTAEETTESPPRAEGCALPLDPQGEKEVKSQDGVRFGGTSTSRHEFFISASLKSSLSDVSNFSIDFRTNETNGLIFYVSGSKDIDFIALFMSEGFIYFLWNCGGGAAMITTKKFYSDGQWHTAKFQRRLKIGSLVIDDMDIGVEESPGDATSLNVKNPVFVGGVPQDISKQTEINLRGIKTSFPGCLRNVFVQGIQLGFFVDSIGHEASGCSSTESGMFFSSKERSFVSLKNKFRVGESIEIKMKIKPRVNDAVILSVRGAKDFLLIQMLDGKIKLSVDNGDGIISTESGVPAGALCDGQWHSILAMKKQHVVSLSVDGGDSVNATGVGDVLITDTSSPLFVGGVPEEETYLSGFDTKEHFVGCIRDIEITGQTITISNATIHGKVNLNTCSTL